MIVSKYFVGGGLWRLLSKDHAVGDLLIVAKMEFIWFICCQTLKINMFTLLIVYMRPLCIYTQSLYILGLISSNEIHQ